MDFAQDGWRNGWRFSKFGSGIVISVTIQTLVSGWDNSFEILIKTAELSNGIIWSHRMKSSESSFHVHISSTLSLTTSAKSAPPKLPLLCKRNLFMLRREPSRRLMTCLAQTLSTYAEHWNKCRLPFSISGVSSRIRDRHARVVLLAEGVMFVSCFFCSRTRFCSRFHPEQAPTSASGSQTKV